MSSALGWEDQLQLKAHPTASTDCGTMIHIVGALMAGYRLEFKQNYAINLTLQLYTRLAIRQLSTHHSRFGFSGLLVTDSSPKCTIEVAVTQIPPPAISQNFLAPVNDTTNRRCQEWTMDYIVQSACDSPNHGVGLNLVGGGCG
ncbi:hypothetical protein CISG_00207 [Coccidioides immitis RMSCC 3703]|uniref:Uncharacterized protein n=2 Tax=Coccidioides immitis TaxID=5501 RepID=A0A0J8QKZ8_COCIT|nr:hypothetical protein CIRG_07332 [Coccidioides immitis RMSCC 2394]KMU71898.1 hypothetical protein CISG_00207 [Coccidioides immitis RMSCC 3703]